MSSLSKALNKKRASTAAKTPAKKTAPAAKRAAPAKKAPAKKKTPEVAAPEPEVTAPKKPVTARTGTHGKLLQVRVHESELAVLDAICAETGQSRTSVIRAALAVSSSQNMRKRLLRAVGQLTTWSSRE